MERIRARLQGRKNIYVHNDLSNAAHHFKKQIEAKIAKGDREGIAFEYMACLLMLALTFEAKINFLGNKLVGDWKERKPFHKKVIAVLNHLKVMPDWSTRPFSSIERLKNFRDSIAHGKPVEIEFDNEVVLAKDEIDRRIDLDGEWMQYCAHDSVFNTYADIETVWVQLLAASQLELIDTITRGSSGLTYIETLTDKDSE